MRHSESWLVGFTRACQARAGWLLLLTCLLAAPSVVAAAADSGQGDAATDGPKLFTAHKCNLCHGVETANIVAKTKSEKLAGPDLSAHEMEDFDALAKFLRKQEEGDDGLHKREFEGTDDELRSILEWLANTPARAAADHGP